jgi:hypothetical protein
MIDVIMIVMWLLIIVVGWVIVAETRSYARSVKYSVQYGMVFDRKSRQLVGTETEILIDEKTGRKWLGKTRILA